MKFEQSAAKTGLDHPLSEIAEESRVEIDLTAFVDIPRQEVHDVGPEHAVEGTTRDVWRAGDRIRNGPDSDFRH